MGCVFLLTALVVPQSAFAQATQSATTNVSVTVSGNILRVTGYIAPFASIALTVSNTVVTSTTADALGYFTFSNVGVPKATTTVCFTAVDYKKLGESQACISVIAVNGVITKTNVFLPPTLGVQRTDVLVGSSAIAFGYGMPGATITVHLNGAAGCTVVADAGGYYQCSIIIKKTGTNELYADSVLHNQPSETQLQKILIQGISQVKTTPIPTLAQVGVPTLPGFNLFAIPWWVWLLLVLIAIILILILLRRYKVQVPIVPIPTGGKLPSINLHHAFDWLFKSRKLHHWWMKGVGF